MSTNLIQNIITEIVFLVAVILLQWLIAPLLAFNSTTPDGLLLYMIFRSLHKENPDFAVVQGLGGGLFLDWLIGGIIGLSSLVLIIAGFTSALVGRENEKLTKTNLMIFGVILISVCSFLSIGIRLHGLRWNLIFKNQFLPVLLYNLLCYSLVVYLFNFKKKRKQI